MHAPVAGGKDAAPAARIAAFPVGDNASRPLDDRDQRNDVEGLQTGLDHEVDKAHGEQTIVVAIAAEASETHRATQGAETLVLFRACEEIGAGGREQRVGKLAASAGANGLGRAAAVAERLAAFGCAGVYTDPAVRLSADVERRLGLRAGTLEDVLAAADILTVHVPLTASTRGIIGVEALGRLKPGAIVVNTSRGGLIDERALAGALESGHVLAAGLDVFEQEPPPAGSPLLALPNVVLSPHIAAGTRDAMRQKMTALFANLERFFATGELQNRVVFP